MRSIFVLLLAAALVLNGSAKSFAACSANGDCNNSTVTTCVGGRNSVAGTGMTFSSTCVGGNLATVNSSTGAACLYVRCGSNTATIVGGPFGKQGCSGDADCLSNEVCISTNGNAGCGTGMSQCAPVCFSSTTSTSTTSSSSSTSSSTSTTSTA